MKNNIHKKFLALRSLARSSLSRFASVILTAIVLSGCGGGGGDSGGNPVAASVVAPNGVRIVEASSTSTTSITVSWLAVSDDTTPAADIRYELHASTDPVFTPATSTLKFSGKGQYTAQINGLSANTQYTVRLVAIDGQGNAAPSNAYTVTTATVDPTLRSDATVYPISESLPVIVDSNSVTLPTAQAAAVQVGQFIAGSTADGYLREVIGLSTQGTNTILQTQPASVNNVLENFQVSSRISMEAMPDSTSTQQAAVAASLARPLATAQTNYTMAWPQSGLRMSSTDAAPHRVSIKAQSAQLTAAVSTPMSSSFDISATQVTESGKFAKVTAPAAVGVVGGKSGEFTVVINKLQDDIDHNIFSPDETIPLTVCEVRLKGITSPDGKNADGLVQVLALESQQTDAATGAIKVAHNQIRITATEAQIAAGFYKVILRTYIGPALTGCQRIGGPLSNVTESIDIEIQIAVVSTPDFPTNQNKTLTFTGGFTVDNSVTYTFDPRLEADVLVQNLTLQSARIAAVANANVTQNFTVTATVSATLDKTLPLFDERKFIKVFMAGGVPVVMSGVFKVDMRVEGAVTGALIASETLKIDFPKLTYGFEYKNGQYTAIKEYQQTFNLTVKGSGNAEANLRISVLPSLNVSFYEAATGRLVLDPNLYAEAGIHGEVLGIVATEGTTSGTDYWLTKAKISASATAYVMADLHVMDRTLFQWPTAALASNYTTWHPIPLLQETPILGLPTLQATPDYSASLPGESRAILIRGSTTDVANPLKTLLGVGPDAYITFAGWTQPKVVETLASGYSLRTGSSKNEFWLVPTKPGNYTVRLGGYSSLGGWARQVADVQITLTDSANDGMTDQWKTKYGVSDPNADDDSDGLSNLLEFQQGRNPKFIDAAIAAMDNDHDGISDAWELSHGLNPYLASDASADRNGDGISNLNEYLQYLQLPTAPTNITPAAGDGQATISWNAIAGTSYNLYMASVTGVTKSNYSTLTGGMKHTGVTSPYTHTGLTNGTPYYFVLTAVNGYGESSESGQVSATPQAAPVVTGKLNDTGITSAQCYQAGSDVIVACDSAGAVALNNAQDGMAGRDANAATNSNTDGKLGFSFSSVPAVGVDPSGCVQDNVTGLMWEVKTTDGGLRDWNKTYTNYSAAYNPSSLYGTATDASGFVTAVNATNLCGYSDWRLPTADELQSVVDYGVASPGPTVDASWFPNTQGSNGFWSVSPKVGDNTYAWHISLYSGGVGYVNRSGNLYVRLVRAGQSPILNRYIESADGQEVTDNQTKLIWRRCAEGMNWDGSTCAGVASTFIHEAALQLAAAQASSTGIAWRLPNVKELSSIADRSLSNPATDSATFPATPASWFWSASPYVGGSYSARLVYFGDSVDNVVNNAIRNYTVYVRLVRTAP